VTITKISDNLYNFSGKALPKNGDSVYNTSGTISYKGDEAIFMYEKPGSAMIRAKYMSQDNNNTFIYTVTATDNEMVKQGEKYNFKKSN
ncbi:MAG: hypothetical protein H7263_09750, partial [Candidatus Sericytochromatia bacterium]|nr:hypothetical protein [Candidatus Sericytochromatia bacterium]